MLGKWCKLLEISLMIDDSDLDGVKFPNDDPLFITSMIGKSQVKRVLIDKGASINIIFYDAFVKMGYNDS